MFSKKWSKKTRLSWMAAMLQKGRVSPITRCFLAMFQYMWIRIAVIRWFKRELKMCPNFTTGWGKLINTSQSQTAATTSLFVKPGWLGHSSKDKDKTCQAAGCNSSPNTKSTTGWGRLSKLTATLSWWKSNSKMALRRGWAGALPKRHQERQKLIVLRTTLNSTRPRRFFLWSLNT